ncbi:hypothetical protein, partial [Burkholderia cepacia]|uniref:hypothetical protein n=1 Tax=Burkholderia cepacia TaxID=292 RepID=UPI002FE21484
FMPRRAVSRHAENPRSRHASRVFLWAAARCNQENNEGLPRRWQSKYAVARPATARYARTSGPPINAASIRRPEQTDFTRERGRRS